MRIFSYLTALFLLAFLWTAPVQAQTIDAAGAAGVRQAVEDALDYYRLTGQQTGQAKGEGLSFAGPIEVTPKTGYYEVKIPDVKLGSETANLDVGTIMLNVTPEGDGDYRASIAVPQQMTMQDKNGADRMTVTLGQQKFSGIWRPALMLFTQAAGEYRDVALTLTPAGGSGPTGPVTITIGELKSQLAMQPDGEVWSGPQSTSVRNVAFAFGENNASRISLDQMDAVANYKKLDLSVHKKLRDTLKAKMAENGSDLPPEAVRDIMRTTVSNLQSIPEGIDTKLTASGVTFDLAAREAVAPTETTPAQPARGPVNLRIDQISSDSSVIGMKNDNGTARASWRLQGLRLQGMDSPLSGSVPNEISLNLNSANVPFKSALETIFTATENALTAQGEAQSAAEAKAQSRLYVQQALATLPGLFAKAGTTFGISDTYMKAADISGSLDGQLKAVETSPYAFAGTMTLVMTGMDELIVKLQEAARTSANPKAAGWAQMLILMQLSGQKDQTEDGKSRRTYAIELKPDGGIALNGADVGGMLQRQPATPAPAPSVNVPATPAP